MSNNAFANKNIFPNNPSGASTAKPNPSAKRHSEFFFNDSLVSIQVEDTLFNVHKYQLLKSETFSDMFKIPNVGGGEPEGSSPEHPIIMEGVKAEDFVALLKMLYAGRFSTDQTEPGATLIVPAFRLANMWNFSDLRSHLIPLAEKVMDDIDKVLFAREFDIQDWLVPAHVRLCQRQEKLTTEEARKLGVDTVLLIARLGQQGSQAPAYIKGQWYCDHCLGFVRKGGWSNCNGCQGNSGANAHNIYGGPGSYMQNKGDSSPQLEAEVKKWVQAGCVFEDD
ncbi:BTB/POZ domain protein [Rhizoctonia solani AG-3 Rhs1AP]|uniref:BTB/POZ domain protein n=2 Tax=Rhizoctonia solani AG-3 TaxID=1086053 RepID=A0A074RNS2_9AGAM|nr:BTB/POZ domain protein [Rhizoctonia solani AG-3 Rhs1AP]KEP46308.1 BTB/POZ domain protein [Rhizoctonia solani 123E]